MNDGAAGRPPLVVVFDPELPLAPIAHEAALRDGGFAYRAGDEPRRHGTVLRGTTARGRRPWSSSRAGLGPRSRPPSAHAARDRGIPVLGLIDHEGDGASLKARVAGYDGWSHLACPVSDLVARLGLLLNGHMHDEDPRAEPIPIDVRLLAMVVHAVRNPLNVITTSASSSRCLRPSGPRSRRT